MLLRFFLTPFAAQLLEVAILTILFMRRLGKAVLRIENVIQQFLQVLPELCFHLVGKILYGSLAYLDKWFSCLCNVVEHRFQPKAFALPAQFSAHDTGIQEGLEDMGVSSF